MIQFKKVTFKNFQAVGNRPITVLLDRSPTTMISGQNGSGKSNVLEALTYGLFGKPLKKVNLGGLINSINKKNLLVTVDFSIKGIDYKIIRGQKPGVLEFYVNDELMDQSAASKDYQQRIEHTLGMDYKMFTQMVVLNKEKYIPFLELSTADRRKIVEDILDISVFSYMSEQLKIQMRESSTAVQDAQYELTRTKDKVSAQLRLISESENNIDDQIKELLGEVTAYEEEAVRLTKEYDSLAVSTDLTPLNAKLQSLRNLSQKASLSKSKLNDQINAKQKAIQFLESNDHCPTCKQSIDETFKNNEKADCNHDIDEATRQIAEMQTGLDLVTTQVSEIEAELRQVQEATNKANLLKSKIDGINSNINALKRKAVQLSSKKTDNNYTEELSLIREKETSQEQALNKLLSAQEVLNKCKELLKDDAIKAAVVAEYIDFINNRVNEYLNAMEFYINIRLDENFNDKIEAVNRDGFTYDNLSTGQKCRVSLAICLALMEVASLKNSVVTNVLLIDEILEPLDVNGVSLFMKLVREKLGHKNVFVITQRSEEFADYFRNQISFKLVEGFTEII